MPEKSRRQRYSSRSKRLGKPAEAAVHTQPPVSHSQTATTSAPAAAPRPVAAQPGRGAALMEKVSASRFSNVKKELRTIGIVAGLILIALIIIARVI